MDNRFYVYIYLDPRKPGNFQYDDLQFDYEPFYVGKGCNNRKIVHISEAIRISASNKIINKSNFPNENLYKLRKILKIINQRLRPIIKTYDNLTNEEALKLEVDIINTIGRKDFKQGPLTNQIDGGMGSPKPSAEHRNRLAIAAKNRVWSEESKQKLSLSKVGFKHSYETCLKLRANKGNINTKIFKVTNPQGEIFFTNEGLRCFCEKNNLFHSNMMKVAAKKQTNHKGWLCERLTPIDKTKKTKANSKSHKLISPTGEIFIIYNGLTEFCKQHSLQPSKISQVENKQRPHHKKWKAELITNSVVPNIHLKDAEHAA